VEASRNAMLQLGFLEKFMKQLCTVGLALAIILAVSACSNTFRGVGRDTRNVIHRVERIF